MTLMVGAFIFLINFQNFFHVDLEWRYITYFFITNGRDLSSRLNYYTHLRTDTGILLLVLPKNWRESTVWNEVFSQPKETIHYKQEDYLHLKLLTLIGEISSCSLEQSCSKHCFLGSNLYWRWKCGLWKAIGDTHLSWNSEKQPLTGLVLSL